MGVCLLRSGVSRCCGYSGALRFIVCHICLAYPDDSLGTGIAYGSVFTVLYVKKYFILCRLLIYPITVQASSPPFGGCITSDVTLALSLMRPSLEHRCFRISTHSSLHLTHIPLVRVCLWTRTYVRVLNAGKRRSQQLSLHRQQGCW